MLTEGMHGWMERGVQPFEGRQAQARNPVRLLPKDLQLVKGMGQQRRHHLRR